MGTWGTGEAMSAGRLSSWTDMMTVRHLIYC